ncbi:hypothetical protein K6V78_00925 [Streptococcus gallolyticus]|nr:hypothetical protein [Streptococcus gallolyticus]MBY5040186.1 hypothetical protein [Streptococcus gallolyticus]
MTRRQNMFPLIADDEVLVGPAPQMTLYDESDLISNIKGPYQDKDFSQPVGVEKVTHEVAQEDLLPPLFSSQPSGYSRRERLQRPTPSRAVYSEKTQGQLAREQAREDLKRKKSAAYLQDEKLSLHKPLRQPVTAPLVAEHKMTHLSHLADKLRQDSYILADMPAVYSLEKEDRAKEEAPLQRNSYDFLKRSQVYDYPERQVRRERQVAQELNLTHMEEGME